MSVECPRCGTALPEVSGRGRRRLWCSDGCRKDAHYERRAAERAGKAVRVVEVRRAVPEPAKNPAVVAQVLDELAGQLRDGQKWPQPVVQAARRFDNAWKERQEAEDAELVAALTPPAEAAERRKARERMRRLRAKRRAEQAGPDAEPTEEEQIAWWMQVAEQDIAADVAAQQALFEVEGQDQEPRSSNPAAPGPNRAERRRAEKRGRRRRG